MLAAARVCRVRVGVRGGPEVCELLKRVWMPVVAPVCVSGGLMGFRGSDSDGELRPAHSESKPYLFSTSSSSSTTGAGHMSTSSPTHRQRERERAHKHDKVGK